MARSFRCLRILSMAAGAAVASHSAATHAATWVPTIGSSWNTPGNWNPATVPNAVGASAVFGPNATANRTITNDGGATGQTVGSISFENNGTFTNSLTTGTAGSNLILDNGGSGATITTVASAGTGNNSISVPTSFNDNVTAFVHQTTATSGAGSLNLTAAITGTGGFTKSGDGLATFGTGTKTYTGATLLNGGRLRTSLAARPSATSSFTINGGQLTPISNGSYTFGSGSLNLNGNGATSGPFSAFGGAIRPDRGLVLTITNNVNLQSNSVIHMQANNGTGATATPAGSITLSGVISGIGQLRFTAAGSDVEQGVLILTNDNDYSGGTLVSGGIVAVQGANASLGSGDVIVDNSTSAASIARLRIEAGVLNAISDSATLSLLGGGAANLADHNFAILETGINETVGSLVLGGVTQGAGTYGATGSGASFTFDEYFSGSGLITVVPEPGSLAVLGLLGMGLSSRRRRA